MKQIFLAIIAALAWFALIAQFYLNINSHVAPVPELLIRFFSYFTIDTNLIVALYCSFLLLIPNSAPGKFFSKQTTATAILVYILIVGVVYNIILRFLWAPQGLQRIVDELLHLVTPILFLLYWISFVTKNELKWKNAFAWMIYPSVYGCFVLLRGHLSASKFYPYPFIDMNKLGFNKGIINTIGFVIIFLVTSLLFIGIGKLVSNKKGNLGDNK